MMRFVRREKGHYAIRIDGFDVAYVTLVNKQWLLRWHDSDRASDAFESLAHAKAWADFRFG